MKDENLMNQVFKSFGFDDSDCTKNNFIKINKNHFKKLGANPAAVLSELLSEIIQLYKEGRLDEDGGFCYTIEDMEAETGLTREQQDRALGKLKKYNIVETFVRGLPSKRHFIINIDALKSIEEEKI